MDNFSIVRGYRHPIFIEGVSKAKYCALIMDECMYNEIGVPSFEYLSIVVTSKEIYTCDSVSCDSVKSAIQYVLGSDYIEHGFFIGGYNIFQSALAYKTPYIYDFNMGSDIKLPEFSNQYQLIGELPVIKYQLY